MGGIISCLALAWFLSLFSIDEFVVTSFKELFDMNISVATYYFIALIFGIVIDVVSFITGRRY